MHRLRVEPLAEPGRPDQVGEHDAHEPARAGGVDAAPRARAPAVARPVAATAADTGSARAGSWARIRALELAQPLARLDAQLLDELAARVLVGLQRVGLAVASGRGRA